MVVISARGVTLFAFVPNYVLAVSWVANTALRGAEQPSGGDVQVGQAEEGFVPANDHLVPCHQGQAGLYQEQRQAQLDASEYISGEQSGNQSDGARNRQQQQDNGPH